MICSLREASENHIFKVCYCEHHKRICTTGIVT